MSSGIGQHGLGRKTAGGGDLSPGSRKNLLVSGLPPQPPGQQSQVQPPPLQFGQQRPKKTGLFGEEEDSETSMYFPQSNLFRPDRDMMSSNSPSQLTGGFSNQNFYSQGSLNPSNLGMSSLGMSSSLGGSALGGGSSLGSSALSASSLGGTAFGGSSTTGVTAFGGSSTTGGTAFGGSSTTGVTAFGGSSTTGGTGFGGSGSTGSTGFGGSGSTGSTAFGGSGSTGSTAFGGSGSTGSTAFGGSGSTGSTAFGGSGSTGSTSFGGTSATGTTSGSSSIIGSSLGGATSSSFSALPQRSAIYGPQFRGNNATPTSMNPNLPFSLQQPQQQPSPNRNISAIGGQRSSMTSQQSMQSISKLQNSTSGPMTGMSNTYGFGSSRQIFGADENQPGLDLSEFPTLGNRSNLPSNPLPSSVRNYVGMVSKPVTESTPEFQIQQEDFPALPGAQNPPSSTANDSSRKTPTSSASNTYDVNSSKDWKFPFDKSTNLTKRGIQTSPDGTVSNIPSGMVTDQFGIAGLLTFIRAAEFEPSLVALAPGKDLTTLGLNLNSPENLYSTFQSPWADSPCRPQDIDFHVPAEYLTNIFIRDKLAPIKLNRYGEDLLFFLFYMNGSDVIQLAAAAELYSRDWRYHKEERVWITRVPGVEPLMKTNTFERGTYYFYDAQSWRKVPKEFYLEYDKLEDRPTLPPTIHHNAQTVMAH